MIKLKTDKEIEIMQEGGCLLRKVLHKTLEQAQDGVRLCDLDNFSEKLIIGYGAEPSFKRVKGYRYTLCLCVNDVVVHGIPTEYKLKKGDLVGIDCGVYYRGFHTDSAFTKIIGNTSDNIYSKFVEVGKQTLNEAVKQIIPGNYIYDISKAIQDNIEKKGYSVVRNLVGHGVGKDLHEDPEIPGFIKSVRKKTPLISEGMVLAVEVIYNMGSSEIVYKGNDGWTIATKDGKISGLFEATVAATSHGYIILT